MKIIAFGDELDLKRFSSTVVSKCGGPLIWGERDTEEKAQSLLKMHIPWVLCSGILIQQVSSGPKEVVLLTISRDSSDAQQVLGTLSSSILPFYKSGN